MRGRVNLGQQEKPGKTLASVFMPCIHRKGTKATPQFHFNAFNEIGPSMARIGNCGWLLTAITTHYGLAIVRLSGTA